jgi:hypothetical protein
MGHLINPISLQIKYHGTWKLAWNHYLRKDFAYFFFLDQYIKNILESISYLKNFLNKVFFYEVKYFIKNNIILFFFSFKMMRKTFFKFYWSHKYPFFLFSNYPKFRKKKKLQRRFARFYKRKQIGNFSILDKCKFNSKEQAASGEKLFWMGDSILMSVLKKTKRAFPYDLILRKKIICFKIKNLIFAFFKQKSFNKYLLNDFCLKKAKIKFLILKQIIFLRNIKSYGNALLVFFNTDINIESPIQKSFSPDAACSFELNLHLSKIEKLPICFLL